MSKANAKLFPVLTVYQSVDRDAVGARSTRYVIRLGDAERDVGTKLGLEVLFSLLDPLREQASEERQKESEATS